MGVKTVLTLSAFADLSAVLDLKTARAPLEFSRRFELASGVGADQADRVWDDTGNLAASAFVDLDLAGVLVDALGVQFTLARVRALIVAAALTNVNNVVVGGAAANGWVGPFGGAAHTAAVRPGGIEAFISRDQVGWPVTPGTGDLLRIANSGAGTGVDYSIVVIGASA